MQYFTRPLEALFTIVVAGLLWVLASVPIVTLGPATAAFAAVMMEWGQDGPPSVWSTFWTAFRRHFRQGMWLGFLATIAGVLLSVDLMYGLRATDAPLRAVVMVAAIIGILAVGGTLVFTFPVMVAYPAPWRRVLRNAALFAAAHPLTTLGSLFLLLAASLLVVFIPALLPVWVGFAAWTISRLVRRVFRRFLARQEAAAAQSAAKAASLT
ncbi:YesL family protein [Actinopolymorpha pittospori]|uniref:Membrane protein YesL n=1 Tax=Actinopolymorpha pittospori TaxID=648752 RepID=A0A927N8X3_9ACTN|nr:DUF624 domain-containing protein [Actinopolymorpha pittospori]MBE1612388.1 putative membrane protein YesL [Actinopolymorpha pittospori]